MAESVSRSLCGLILTVSATACVYAQAVERQCGYDRWPVKILADQDKGRVNFTPVDSTITKLVALPIHEIPYPRDRRIEPEELTVYRIRARLLEIRREGDKDLHLLLADPDNEKVRMVAEIPGPECVTERKEDYLKARQLIQSLPKGSTIEVTGVGFWDFRHDASGSAKNGFELHPVLSIEVKGDSHALYHLLGHRHSRAKMVTD